MAEQASRSEQGLLTPERRASVRDLLQTASWETPELLHLPASQVEFRLIDRDLPEPVEAAVIRKETFARSLTVKRNELLRVNPDNNYAIHDDVNGQDATGYPALFEVFQDGQEKKRMWDGTTITLAQEGMKWEGGKFVIPIYPIKYSEWVACSNFKYANSFRQNGLPIPYAGFGVSVLME